MRSMMGMVVAAVGVLAAGGTEGVQGAWRGAAHAAALSVTERWHSLTTGPVDDHGAVEMAVQGEERDDVLELPAPWAPQDSADSLYREARSALSDGDHARAAALFRQIHERFPRSSYAPDALFYEAFALYKAGGETRLRRALVALEAQRTRYAQASTRGDATTLTTRIRGELARRGDRVMAESIATDARAAATTCPDDDEDDDRTAALNALLQMDSEQAIPILQKVLARRDECSAGLRRKAVFLLSQKRTPETADALMRVAQQDPDGEVRQQAVFWLSQVHTERATELLLTILNTSRDQELQEKALFALSQQESERGMKALREYATREDAEDELREKAIFWLGQKRSAENAAFLRSLYGRLRNEELKEKVLFSLSQQQGMGNDRWLLSIAQNEKESTELRKKAIFWLVQGSERATAGVLDSLYDRITDREIREQILFAYSQQRDRAAVDKLMEVARTDRDPELRKKAIFWLGQSRDPRAAEFLLSLIER